MSLLLLFGGTAIAEKLTTWPPNKLPATAFLDSEVLRVAKQNTQAIVLGATGFQLTTDLTVTEGHKHETSTTRLSWRQIATHVLLNHGADSIGAAPDECWDAVLIDGTSPIELASIRLWLTEAEASDLIPRVRVSNDNSAIADCTLTFDFYDLDLVLFTTYDLTFSTATLRNREWVDGVAQDFSAASADAVVTTRYPLICLVSGYLDTAVEFVAIHEIAFGVTP